MANPLRHRVTRLEDEHTCRPQRTDCFPHLEIVMTTETSGIPTSKPSRRRAITSDTAALDATDLATTAEAPAALDTAAVQPADTPSARPSEAPPAKPDDAAPSSPPLATIRLDANAKVVAEPRLGGPSGDGWGIRLLIHSDPRRELVAARAYFDANETVAAALAEVESEHMAGAENSDLEKMRAAADRHRASATDLEGKIVASRDALDAALRRGEADPAHAEELAGLKRRLQHTRDLIVEADELVTAAAKCADAALTTKLATAREALLNRTKAQREAVARELADVTFDYTKRMATQDHIVAALASGDGARVLAGARDAQDRLKQRVFELERNLPSEAELRRRATELEAAADKRLLERVA